MIEMLVTVVILSIGLLGMAAMQLTGLRSTNSATYRTQATLFANDIVERIRANTNAVDNNLFMAVDSTANIDCNTLPSPYCAEFINASNEVIIAETCNSAQMAAYDLNVWFCGVASMGNRAGGASRGLPQATATITCIDTDPPLGPDADPCTNRSPHTIAVSWIEVNPEQSGANTTIEQNVSLTIQP
ncbi:MAG: type IV pilus modification protein PilV [Gammaproteobacteria bacterium]|nr:type IV pilus modification protein PilV [Gammaproteobacteria bacterium]